jgi:hypothetical protein
MAFAFETTACPHCHAAPCHPCRQPSGRAVAPHKARETAHKARCVALAQESDRAAAAVAETGNPFHGAEFAPPAVGPDPDRASGMVLYHGPSELDGAPIVVVATFASANRKTGPLAQTWILRADCNPLDALRRGADSSICGDCPHRGPEGNGKGRSCYVNVAQAPLQVWRSWQRGRYASFDAAALGRRLAGRFLRIGSYGDPAAVPQSVWREVLPLALRAQGYTHQWRNRRFAYLAGFCMASVDSPRDLAIARLLGFRAFVVTTPDQLRDLPPDLLPCPASEEAGRRLTCASCLACQGNRVNRPDVVILVHGPGSVLASARRNLAALVS